MIKEVDRVCLRVLFLDFKRPDTGRIVDCRVLKTAHLLAAVPFEGQELDVHLDVMARNLLLIPFGVQFAHACISVQEVETVASENAINPSI